MSLTIWSKQDWIFVFPMAGYHLLPDKNEVQSLARSPTYFIIQYINRLFHFCSLIGLAYTLYNHTAWHYIWLRAKSLTAQSLRAQTRLRHVKYTPVLCFFSPREISNPGLLIGGRIMLGLRVGQLIKIMQGFPKLVIQVLAESSRTRI